MRIGAAAVVVGLAAAFAGCASTRTINTGEDGPTVLRVENQSYYDMNIYVLPEGSTRQRLGTAVGKGNVHFTLPRRVVPGGVRSLRFLATPIATQRGEISEEILVTPGDTVVLVIPPY